MITELYQDKGLVDKDGAKVPYTNHAHLWWVRFSNGATRPAEETEIELWERSEQYRQEAERLRAALDGTTEVVT